MCNRRLAMLSHGQTNRKEWVFMKYLILVLAAALAAPLEAQEEISVPLPGGEPLEMIKVEAGTFLMGTSYKQIEAWRKDNAERRKIQPTSAVTMPISGEWPQHSVTITKPFYLGKREVSRRQWFAVMDPNREEEAIGEPMSRITWGEVQDFIALLNARSGRFFRLPTEAEWEYAARAGTTTWWWMGNDVREVARIILGPSMPNPWGFLGISGGVWEYMEDGEREYGNSDGVDPMGPDPREGREVVVRGGDNGEYFSLGESPNGPITAGLLTG